MKYRKLVALFWISITLLCSSCTLFPVLDSDPITAILGAFDEEVTILQKQLTGIQEQEIEGISFVTGRLRGKRVVIAWTGIGKVNAAMTTTLLIEHFRPNEVVFTGIAGGINPDLQPGDIVIAAKTAQHDLCRITPDGIENFGVHNPANQKRNPVFFQADERLVKLAELSAKQVAPEKIKTSAGQRAPKIIKGVVVTGDAFIASPESCTELRNRLGADAVEMEGAAVAQICYQRNVPCIVIRSISDKANEKAVEDVEKFYKMAARNSASLVVEMVAMSLKD